MAILAHQGGYGAALSSRADAALTLAALAVLLWPRRRALLAGLAAIHLAVVGLYLPSVYNHWYFAALVSLALLAALLTAPERFAAAGQASLVLLYAATGFHKLNRDFFDPTVSCATTLYGQLRAQVPWLPSAGTWDDALPAAVLAIELGLPVLLLVRRTRAFGVLLAVGFHILMALAGYPRFSATGGALLLLFLPPGSLAWPDSVRIAAAIASGVAVVLGQETADPFFLWISIGVLLVIGAAAARQMLRTSAPRPAPPFGWPGWAAVGPALIVLSTLAPYLGLGTERAFAMYSNLRTEGGRSNHLLYSARWMPLGYQRDLVEVLESADDRATPGLVVPFQELRARLSAAPADRGAGRLVFRRAGARIEVLPGMADSLLGLPVPRWQRKLLRFRAVELAGPRRCGV